MGGAGGGNRRKAGSGGNSSQAGSGGNSSQNHIFSFSQKSADGSGSSKKPRPDFAERLTKAPYTFIELEVLLSEYLANKRLLDCAQKGEDVVSKRKNCWNRIAASMTKTSSVIRTAEKVQDKLRRLQTSAKKQVAIENKYLNATGGGLCFDVIGEEGVVKFLEDMKIKHKRHLSDPTEKYVQDLVMASLFKEQLSCIEGADQLDSFIDPAPKGDDDEYLVEDSDPETFKTGGGSSIEEIVIDSDDCCSQPVAVENEIVKHIKKEPSFDQCADQTDKRGLMTDGSDFEYDDTLSAESQSSLTGAFGKASVAGDDIVSLSINTQNKKDVKGNELALLNYYFKQGNYICLKKTYTSVELKVSKQSLKSKGKTPLLEMKFGPIRQTAGEFLIRDYQSEDLQIVECSQQGNLLHVCVYNHF